MVYSFLYKESPVFRFVEHLFIGIATGNLVVLSYKNITDMAIAPLLVGGFGWIIPLVLGVLLFTRFFPKYFWLSRYPAAYMVGVGTGLALRTYTHAQFTRQIVATLKPVTGVDSITAFNNFLILIMVVAITFYFIFSDRIRGAGAGTSSFGRLGRIAVMFSFGATYGTTVATRMAYLIGRIQFLLIDWLGVAS
jgi:hypothetical protein